MARPEQRHPRNAAGPWYVDTRCIDCDTCRELAPETFVDVGGQTAVAAQPATPDAEHRAWLAAVACPTQSIGQHPRQAKPAGLFPHLLDHHEASGTDVRYLGWTSEDSFGADSYLVTRPGGNLLIDGPRWTRFLAEPIADLGGIAHVLLTHRDDVADAQRYAEHFGARVWIHADDARAAPAATDLLQGTDVVEVAPGVRGIPVPGHTKGSVVWSVDDRLLLSGDSLAWSRERNDLTAFRGACWYSWTEQGRSLDRLAGLARFEWLLPGHGGRVHADPDDLHARLVRLAARMRRAA